MSAVTRAKSGQRVVFKDAAGKERSGVALLFRSDSMLVGYQSEERPMISVYDAGKGQSRRVPNNTLWVVPYTDVIRTEM